MVHSDGDIRKWPPLADREQDEETQQQCQWEYPLAERPSRSGRIGETH